MFKYKYVFTWISLWSLFLFLFIVIFNNVIIFNPISNDLKSKEIVFRFIPQGWAFFTKSPREEEIVIYDIIEGEIVENSKYKHSSYKNFFGLKRNVTKTQTELLLVLNKIDDKYFKTTKWNFMDFKYGNNFNIDSVYEVKLKNILIKPKLKGKHLVVKQKQIPWAWAKNSKNLLIPSKVIILNFKNE